MVVTNGMPRDPRRIQHPDFQGQLRSILLGTAAVLFNKKAEDRRSQFLGTLRSQAPCRGTSWHEGVIIYTRAHMHIYNTAKYLHNIY